MDGMQQLDIDGLVYLKLLGVVIRQDSSETISIGGDFGLGGAASCLARRPLPYPAITDLDQAVEQPIDYIPLADLRPFSESLDDAGNSVEPHGGLPGSVADAADGEVRHGAKVRWNEVLGTVVPVQKTIEQH